MPRPTHREQVLLGQVSCPGGEPAGAQPKPGSSSAGRGPRGRDSVAPVLDPTLLAPWSVPSLRASLVPKGRSPRPHAEGGGEEEGGHALPFMEQLLGAGGCRGDGLETCPLFSSGLSFQPPCFPRTETEDSRGGGAMRDRPEMEPRRGARPGAAPRGKAALGDPGQPFGWASTTRRMDSRQLPRWRRPRTPQLPRPRPPASPAAGAGRPPGSHSRTPSFDALNTLSSTEVLLRCNSPTPDP